LLLSREHTAAGAMLYFRLVLRWGCDAFRRHAFAGRDIDPLR